MHRMSSPTSPQRKEMQRKMMWLIGSVAVVHSAVIAIYYALHIASRPMKTQQTFIAAWVVLTLIVVVPQMKGIRQMRKRRTE